MNNFRISVSILRLKHQLRKKGVGQITVNGRKILLAKSHLNFWKQVEQEQWEPETFSILDHYLTKDSVYWDIGSWIGPTVCYAAFLVNKVIAFEPDPYAFYILKENILLNKFDNTKLIPKAVHFTKRKLRMASKGGSLGDSQSSSLQNDAKKFFYSSTIIPEEMIQEFPYPHFVKMDIEGGEFELLQSFLSSFNKKKPVLYLSMHSPYLPNDERKPAMINIITILSKLILDKLSSLKVE